MTKASAAARRATSTGRRRARRTPRSLFIVAVAVAGAIFVALLAVASLRDAVGAATVDLLRDGPLGDVPHRTGREFPTSVEAVGDVPGRGEEALQGAAAGGTAPGGSANAAAVPSATTSADADADADAGARVRTLSVISYSAYGDKARYTAPLLLNARDRAPHYYPGWQVRIYHDATVPRHILNQLRELDHVRLVNVSDVGVGVGVGEEPGAEQPLLPAEWGEWLPKINPMVWRFLAGSDPTVREYIIRDADALLGVREAAAVREWLSHPDDAAFHVMHDHPRHYFWNRKNVTVPGGMWGARGGRLPDMAALLREWYVERPRRAKGGRDYEIGGGRQYGEDQDFLTSRIWPLVEALGPAGSVRHNSFHCDSNDGVAFPTAGMWDVRGGGYDFVGSTFRPDSKTTVTNRDGICDLGKMMNASATGDKWRGRYERCIRRRTERGLEIANASGSVAGASDPPPNCSTKKPTYGMRVKTRPRFPPKSGK